MTLQFTQIYYDDSQLAELYGFSSPYKNLVLTDFFENDVIAREVPGYSADYIGVASWRLREKRQSGFCPMILNIYGNDDLSEEKILKSDADVINLRPFKQGHQMLKLAQGWHGGEQHNYAWEKAIADLKKIIDIPEEVKTPIYENAFIAKREIYHGYCNTFLSPVLEYMRDRAVYLLDSGYLPKKQRTNPDAVKKYQEKTGRIDWPIAPFVLERLFSIWINDKDFKIVNA